jgi:hypothetical protein
LEKHLVRFSRGHVETMFPVTAVHRFVYLSLFARFMPLLGRSGFLGWRCIEWGRHYSAPI